MRIGERPHDDREEVHHEQDDHGHHGDHEGTEGHVGEDLRPLGQSAPTGPDVGDPPLGPGSERELGTEQCVERSDDVRHIRLAEAGVRADPRVVVRREILQERDPLLAHDVLEDVLVGVVDQGAALPDGPADVDTELPHGRADRLPPLLLLEHVQEGVELGRCDASLHETRNVGALDEHNGPRRRHRVALLALLALLPAPTLLLALLALLRGQVGRQPGVRLPVVLGDRVRRIRNRAEHDRKALGHWVTVLDQSVRIPLGDEDNSRHLMPPDEVVDADGLRLDLRRVTRHEAGHRVRDRLTCPEHEPGGDHSSPLLDGHHKRRVVAREDLVPEAGFAEDRRSRRSGHDRTEVRDCAGSHRGRLRAPLSHERAGRIQRVRVHTGHSGHNPAPGSA